MRGRPKVLANRPRPISSVPALLIYWHATQLCALRGALVGLGPLEWQVRPAAKHPPPSHAKSLELNTGVSPGNGDLAVARQGDQSERSAEDGKWMERRSGNGPAGWDSKTKQRQMKLWNKHREWDTHLHTYLPTHLTHMRSWGYWFGLEAEVWAVWR